MHERNDVIVIITLLLAFFGCMVFFIFIEENNKYDDSVRTAQISHTEYINTTKETKQTSNDNVKIQTSTTTTTVETTCYNTTRNTQIETKTQETTSETTKLEGVIENTEETTTIQEEGDKNEYITDAIIIKDKCIELNYGPVDQNLVDLCDVVEDDGNFSTETTKFFFGHVTKSFKILKDVNVGEVIRIRNSGDEVSYKVQRSELAEVVRDGYDIKLCADETYLIDNNFTEETIVLVTCTEDHAKNFRWIVIATIE